MAKKSAKRAAVDRAFNEGWNADQRKEYVRSVTGPKPKTTTRGLLSGIDGFSSASFTPPGSEEPKTPGWRLPHEISLIPGGTKSGSQGKPTTQKFPDSGLAGTSVAVPDSGTGGGMRQSASGRRVSALRQAKATQSETVRQGQRATPGWVRSIGEASAAEATASGANPTGGKLRQARTKKEYRRK